eukprot:GHVU01166727.1.p1 GENE.GHVU01166727.1~~GHVU01166727.1.p1  ORF type:complete len:213 (+),score=43.81 GHVU01166727.1:205-843(+)
MVDIKDDPPREGNRGGLDLFKWNSVKNQSWKDRECYLGHSVKVGMQGKFGRYGKNDWWSNSRGDAFGNLQQEQDKVRQYEEELFKEALGEAPKKHLLNLKSQQDAADEPSVSQSAPVPSEADAVGREERGKADDDPKDRDDSERKKKEEKERKKLEKESRRHAKALKKQEKSVRREQEQLRKDEEELRRLRRERKRQRSLERSCEPSKGRRR